MSALENENRIETHLLIGAGKGGVGKSTIAVNIAIALKMLGARVGLLDADVHGPSIPMMLGVEGEQPRIVGDRVQPIEAHGILCMSMGLLVDSNQAMIWRGPMLARALVQLLQDVDWGQLDYLIVDLPPGTGDVPLTVAQKAAGSMAVLVTTPQDVALADVRRLRTMLEKVQIPVLGLIENMSYLVCPHCREEVDLFDRGGAERASLEMGLEFFGAIPMEPAIRQGADAGLPHLVVKPNGFEGQAILEIARLVDEAARARSKAASATKKRDLKVVQ